MSSENKASCRNCQLLTSESQASDHRNHIGYIFSYFYPENAGVQVATPGTMGQIPSPPRLVHYSYESNAGHKGLGEFTVHFFLFMTPGVEPSENSPRSSKPCMCKGRQMRNA